MDMTWQHMRALPRRPVAGLAVSDVPKEVGVYVWFRNGEPVYVGEALGALGLRRRLREHLKVGADMSRSTLRRSLAEHLLGVPRSVSSQRPTVMAPGQVNVVNEWIRGCELAWQVCDNPGRAHEVEAALRADWSPPFNRI